MEESNKPRVRVFKNDHLEKLTKSDPVITMFFYGFLILLFLYLNDKYSDRGTFESIIFYVSGLAGWSLMEYILHRFILHIDDYIPGLKRFHYILHGAHHENPKDDERLFIPPVPGAVVAGLMFGFWYLFLGWGALAFMAGICSGYLVFSFMHYTIHTNPKTVLFRKMCIHHTLHHYKDRTKAFGVTSPLWDKVFRTMPQKQEQFSAETKNV